VRMLCTSELEPELVRLEAMNHGFDPRQLHFSFPFLQPLTRTDPRHLCCLHEKLGSLLEL